MRLRNFVLGIFGLVLLAPARANAIDRCSARVSAKTGAVEASAVGVAGVATWSGSATAPGLPFADAASCAVGDRLRRCHLGAAGTLAAITPPVECRVCVHDEGTTPCCAVLRGCTPGVRVRDASFAANDPRVCQGLGSADPACAPLGLWERTTNLVRLGYLLVPDLLQLGADSTAALASRDENGAVRCHRGAFTKGAGNEIVLDTESAFAKLFRYRTGDADSLDLIDSAGTVVSFTRRDATPADLVCRELVVLQRFDGLPRADSSSGLAFDGTTFWYTDPDGGTIPIDPLTGAPGTPLALGGAVQAAQDATFWVVDRDSFSLIEARRVQRDGVVVDVVSAPIGNLNGLSGALAVDVPGDRLFLGGRPSDAERTIISVRTAPEPDVFIAAIDVGQFVRHLAFDGTDLWAVEQRQRLFRIDPETGAIRDTFLLPPNIEWHGVAIANGDLVLLGTDFDGEPRGSATIVRVRPA